MARNELTSELIDTVKKFLLRLGRQRAALAVSLESELEKDLGIDSIGKVELFHEIEEQFQIYLPDDLIATALTLHDLTIAIEKSHPAIQSRKTKRFIFSKGGQYQPSNEKSIVEVLRNWVKYEPNRPHIYLQSNDDKELRISYKQLLHKAEKAAAHLYLMGIRQFDTVAIMLPTSEDFFYSFIAIQLLGAVPVPIYPPFRPDKIEEYALREAKILEKAEVKILITFDQAEKLSALLSVFIKSLKHVVTYKQLAESKKKAPNAKISGDHPALIQFTSGSTSDPKGVLLTHFNLLSNIRSLGESIGIKPNDVVVSWLPLYHDMGLIGCWLGSLYYGRPLVVMSPLHFLTRPERWLWAIHYHRGTISAGPNFAYELCVKRIQPEKLEGLDLGSWRMALNGAEAVNPKTLSRFNEKFAKYHFNSGTFFPAYGLAESCVAVCFPPVGRGPLIDRVKLEDYQVKQIANPEVKSGDQTLDFVACGKPIPNHDIRVVNDEGDILQDRVIGHLQFKGPSTMQGYYNNLEATQKVFDGEWCKTGDLAYLVDGELYITGRQKDIIIKAGRNLYPETIEEIASQVTGVRKGCVAAFGTHDIKKGTEKLILVAESKEQEKETRLIITDQISNQVTEALGIPPDEVIIVSPGIIPKTSSGKLQRSQCKHLYEQGKLLNKKMPMWLQISKLSIKGFFKKIKDCITTGLQFIYTLYCWMVIIICLTPTILSVFLLPGRLSRIIARFFCKLILFLMGNRVTVINKERLKTDQPMVLVANHSSYADATVLYACMPEKFSFVVKKEVAKLPLVRTIIRRHKHILVDRIDFSKSLEDSQKITQALEARRSVGIFPEGTFTYAAGIKSFKSGAFKIAVDNDVPICPMGIRGTRSILASGQWLLKPAHVQLHIGELLSPKSNDWDEVITLQREARKAISALANEPVIEE